MSSNERVLVVVSHPDDEAFGCGALLHRWAQDGAQITALVFGEGPTSRLGRPNAPPGYADVATNQIRNRARRALQQGLSTIGVISLQSRHLCEPDQRFDTVPILQFAQEVERDIRVFNPSIVLTHDLTDGNEDHRIIHKAVLAATRPRPGRSSVRAVYTFEVPGSSEWRFAERFRPTRFVPVTEENINAKIAAIRAYGELAEVPDPRSEPMIRAQLAQWGSLVGVPAAEPLRCLWEIR